MASYHGREYDYTEASLTELLVEQARQRGSSARIEVTLIGLPQDAVEIEYHWPQILWVRLPQWENVCSRTWFLVHRLISVWPLFVAVRMRYEDVAGKCLLWLDDLPHGSGFAFSGYATSHVLIPDANFIDTRGYLGYRLDAAALTPPWADRRDLVFWRGASTGSRPQLRVRHWQELPRFRLCLLARQWARDDLFDIGLSSIVQIWDAAEIEQIGQADLLRPGVGQLEFGLYRHTIDIDGNSNSWQGLFTKLLLGTTVLKVDSPTGVRQWYYDQLVPWKNFVPVSDSMAELPHLAVWLQACPAEAEAIARRGRELAEAMTFEAVLESQAPRIRAALRT